jgi:hypothetical protein
LPILKSVPLLNNAFHSGQLTLSRTALCITAGLRIFLLASVIGASHAATVTTSGFDLRLNGTQMVIKGMDYSPVPIGTAPGTSPYGDYFVPQYTNVWTPDIQSMRAAGVNAIKLYAGNPALNAGAPGSSGNWEEFLDACYNGGTNPIYVVMFSYVQGDVIAAGKNAMETAPLHVNHTGTVAAAEVHACAASFSLFSKALFRSTPQR